MEIKPGIYKHSKTGNLHKVHFIAKHSETLEDVVVYEDLHENELSKFWVRPAKIWFEEVEIEGQVKPRFEWVSES